MVLELRNYPWQVVAIFPIYVLLLLTVKNKKNRVFHYHSWWYQSQIWLLRVSIFSQASITGCLRTCRNLSFENKKWKNSALFFNPKTEHFLLWLALLQPFHGQSHFLSQHCFITPSPSSASILVFLWKIEMVKYGMVTDRQESSSEVIFGQEIVHPIIMVI